jgi:predicted short-subunit dehydrogenase-like oxidoreductase (DUF2520 family)
MLAVAAHAMTLARGEEGQCKGPPSNGWNKNLAQDRVALAVVAAEHCAAYSTVYRTPSKRLAEARWGCLWCQQPRLLSG